MYEERFNEPLKTILERHGYWVFAWNVKDSLNVNDPDIYKRVQIVNNRLHITCFKDDKDYSGLNLNPRAELRVDGYKLKPQTAYRATIQMQLGQRDSGFEFFQIMVASFPALQLEVRDGKFGVRVKDVDKNQLNPVGLVDAHTNPVLWEVEFFLDYMRGYFNVFMDKKKVWSMSRKTMERRPSNTSAWTQYGVYKNRGNANDQTLIVDYLKLEEF